MTFAVCIFGFLAVLSWTCAAYGAGISVGLSECRDRRYALHRELADRIDVEDQRDRAVTLVTYWQAEVVRLRGELRELQDRDGGPYRS